MGNWFSKDMDLAVAAQLKRHFSKEPKTTHPFVTISREYGCDGNELAALVAQKMTAVAGEQPWEVVSSETLHEAHQEGKLSAATLKDLERYGHSELTAYVRDAVFGMGNLTEVVQQISKITHLLAAKGHVVFLGGGASIITSDMAKGIHIRLYAPESWRIGNHAKRWKLSDSEALKRVKGRHNEREAYVKAFLGEDIADPAHYHLMVDNARVGAEEAADLIVAMIKSRN